MRNAAHTLMIVLLAALLGACGRSPAPAAQGGGSASLVMVEAGDTRESVAARYGAEVAVWRPEAGFAVLEGAAPAGGGLSPLSAQAEPNRSVATPGRQAVEALGWTAWSSGWTAWSSGWTVWSSGWTVWSSGQGGSLTPTENHPVWEQIGLFAAHELAGRLGEGVKVAVIDTGIDVAHPIFAGRLAPAGEWRDFVDGDTDPAEAEAAPGDYSAYGHGTGNAGVILQIAPNATILPLRALGPDGSGEVGAVAAAIDHAITAGADIINLSLGTPTHSPVLSRMVRLAAEHGVYVVSSSGNTGDQKISYPAASGLQENKGGLLALGVGSVELDDSRSDFSTYGQRLELVAPGRSIYTSAPDERLAAWTGTSSAAAMVSGVLALALAEAPQARDLAVLLTQTAASVDAANPEYAGMLGYGRVDAEALVRAALE